MLIKEVIAPFPPILSATWILFERMVHYTLNTYKNIISTQIGWKPYFKMWFDRPNLCHWSILVFFLVLFAQLRILDQINFLCDVINTKRENKLFTVLLVLYMCGKLTELTVSQGRLRLCFVAQEYFCAKSVRKRIVPPTECELSFSTGTFRNNFDVIDRKIKPPLTYSTVRKWPKIILSRLLTFQLPNANMATFNCSCLESRLYIYWL